MKNTSEYADWQLQPQKLTKDEAKHPYLVLSDFFDIEDLHDTRELLWLWLSCTVTGNFTHELNRIERDRILSLYTRLEKLIDAVHVLHVLKKKEKKKKKD